MSTEQKKRPHLYLAAKDGRRLCPDRVPAFDAPEAPLSVSFTGLTPEEQLRALAAFPGGKRFRLVPGGR